MDSPKTDFYLKTTAERPENIQFVPGRATHAVAERYRAPHREFPGHGHMIVAEPGWQEVADAVARFAESHETTPARGGG